MLHNIEESQASLRFQTQLPYEFEPYPGYVAHIIPKHDPRVVDALQFELETLTMLGDSDIKEDQVETFQDSGFIVVNHESDSDRLLGAIRFMLPAGPGKNRTFSDTAKLSDRTIDDVEQKFLQQSLSNGSIVVPQCVDLSMIIDASILAPRIDKVEEISLNSDILLGACRVVGNALFETQRMTHVTAFLHGIFLKHAAKQGYPFQELLDESGELIAAFEGKKTGFYSVHTSLDLYMKLMHNAPADSHLGKVKESYGKLDYSQKVAISDAMETTVLPQTKDSYIAACKKVVV